MSLIACLPRLSSSRLTARFKNQSPTLPLAASAGNGYYGPTKTDSIPSRAWQSWISELRTSVYNRYSHFGDQGNALFTSTVHWNCLVTTVSRQTKPAPPKYLLQVKVIRC